MKINGPQPTRIFDDPDTLPFGLNYAELFKAACPTFNTKLGQVLLVGTPGGIEKGFDFVQFFNVKT